MIATCKLSQCTLLWKPVLLCVMSRLHATYYLSQLISYILEYDYKYSISTELISQSGSAFRSIRRSVSRAASVILVPGPNTALADFVSFNK